MSQNLVIDNISNLKNNFRPPSTKFPPDMWVDTFTSFVLDDQVQETYVEIIESLKKEVKKRLIMIESNVVIDKLLLIDTLERLGISYHFEQEIKDQLQHISKLCSDDYDLFTTALHFRLLRQHHHYISTDVFNKFVGKNNGKFDEKLTSDPKELLSLYEAAQMRTHDEDILEEAMKFTTQHLNIMVNKLESPFRERVNRALEQQLQRGVPRIEAWHYIALYEQDNFHDEQLLKLAKIDFNYVQNVHKKELHDLTRWWHKINLKSKLSYTRDRVVECYFWGTTFHFEPQYYFLRLAASKYALVATVIDDTYDNHATIEEAQLFTNALQRWNIEESDLLPDYMKHVYKFVLSVYEELEHEVCEQGRSFTVPYVKEVIKELAQGYNEELKWLLGTQVLTWKDQLSLFAITGAAISFVITALLGLKSASNHIFDWLIGKPKLIVAASHIGRFCNDIASYKREDKQGHMLTTITNYVQQYGVTMQETLSKFTAMVEDTWKDINAEWLQLPSYIPHDVAITILNYARSCGVIYKHSHDGYSYPEKTLAPQIVALFVNPIVI